MAVAAFEAALLRAPVAWRKNAGRAWLLALDKRDALRSPR